MYIYPPLSHLPLFGPKQRRNAARAYKPIGISAHYQRLSFSTNFLVPPLARSVLTRLALSEVPAVPVGDGTGLAPFGIGFGLGGRPGDPLATVGGWTSYLYLCAVGDMFLRMFGSYRGWAPRAAARCWASRGMGNPWLLRERSIEVTRQEEPNARPGWKTVRMRAASRGMTQSRIMKSTSSWKSRPSTPSAISTMR